MMDLVNAVWGRHVLSCWYTKPSIRLDDYLCGQVLGVDWDDETHVSSLDVVSQLTLV